MSREKRGARGPAGHAPDRGFTAPEDGPLLALTRAAFPQTPAGTVKSWLEHGLLAVDGTATTRFDAPVRAGQRVTVLSRSPVPSPLPILYEDGALLAVTKPSGLLTVATDEEKERTAIRLMREAGRGPLFVVHRLDRDTGGVLLFAKSPELREKLQAGWGTVKRGYLAVCEGVFSPKSGTIESFLAEDKNHMVHSAASGKRAVTRYRVLAETPRFSLVELWIETGRKNQIRVHMKELGHPVAGDRKYGSGRGPAGRLLLHAGVLELDHPITGARLRIQSPPPKELTEAGLGRL